MTIELRPHQEAALKQLSNGNILWGAVGSGKGRVAVGYYEREHTTRDVYVITTAKKRDAIDWQTDFARIGVGSQPDATIHGLLTVDSWNNLEKYIHAKNAFFIFDEQRLVGSGKWVRSFLKIARNNYWILLTATPGDTWLDYIPVFVANGFYKNRTEFKLEHVRYAPHTKFPKVIGYIGERRLKKCRDRILVHMRYSSEKVKHYATLTVDHNEELVQLILRDRWHIYENRPIKDITELFGVMRRVVNSDPSRAKRVYELLQRHPKIVLFYNFNYELDILRRIKGVEIAEWNGWKHEPLPISENWVYLVQYIAGSEGWNCRETDTTLFYSYTYSYKMWHQAHGRIDRMDTPFTDLNYYELRSKSGVDRAIRRSLVAKENFQPAKFDVSTLGQKWSENSSVRANPIVSI